MTTPDPVGETFWTSNDPIEFMRKAWSDYLTNAYRHAVATVAVRTVEADGDFRGHPLNDRERQVAAASAAVALLYAARERQETASRCPRCNGQGHTVKPPWIAGDVHEWPSTTTATHPCPPCNGTGILR